MYHAHHWRRYWLIYIWMFPIVQLCATFTLLNYGFPVLDWNILYESLYHIQKICPRWFFNPPPLFEAVHCFICGRRRMAFTRFQMNCLVLLYCIQHLCNTLQYHLIHTETGQPSAPACRSTPVVLNATSGNILSSGYQGGADYPPNQNCKWKINAPAGKVITLNFNVRKSHNWENVKHGDFDFVFSKGQFYY